MSPRDPYSDRLENSRIVRYRTRQTCRQIKIGIVETDLGETNFVGRNPSGVSVISGCLPLERIVWKRVADLRAEIIDRAGRRYVGSVNSLERSTGIDRASGRNRKHIIELPRRGVTAVHHDRAQPLHRDVWQI